MNKREEGRNNSFLRTNYASIQMQVITPTHFLVDQFFKNSTFYAFVSSGMKQYLLEWKPLSTKNISKIGFSFS